jgi:hypothetical protein
VKKLATEKRLRDRKKDDLNHVGGVSDTLGGVDPAIEETLLRLSDGP